MFRKYNEAADTLAKMVPERASIHWDIFTSDLHRPSVDYKEGHGTDDAPTRPAPTSETSAVPKPEAMDIEQEEPELNDQPYWCIPYLKHLVYGTLHVDPTEARRLARRATTFILLDGKMYKCSPSGILLCCITLKEGMSFL